MRVTKIRAVQSRGRMSGQDRGAITFLTITTNTSCNQ